MGRFTDQVQSHSRLYHLLFSFRHKSTIQSYENMLHEMENSNGFHSGAPCNLTPTLNSLQTAMIEMYVDDTRKSHASWQRFVQAHAPGFPRAHKYDIHKQSQDDERQSLAYLLALTEKVPDKKGIGDPFL